MTRRSGIGQHESINSGLDTGDACTTLIPLFFSLFFCWYNRTHREIIIGAERCLFCGYSLKRARLNVHHVGKFTVKFRRNWKTNRHTSIPPPSSSISATHYTLKNFVSALMRNYTVQTVRTNLRIKVRRPRAALMRDNLSRIYCCDKLFMNPLLAKGENSTGSIPRAHPQRTVSIFSQISPVALEAVVSICRGFAWLAS